MKHFLLSFLFAGVLLLSGCRHGEGMTPLLIAAHDGETADLRALLADGADVNQTSRYGWTGLIFAAREGHADVVEIMLEAGGDPNVVTEKIPPGFMATRGGYFETTALAEAIRNDHLEIANRLIDQGAQVESLSVALAGKKGDLNLLDRMLKGGADLNLPAKTAYYSTALCEAAKQGNLEAVRWLHEHGAKVNVPTGRSLPLHCAITSKNPEVVDYLLQQGADPNLSAGDAGYHHNTALGKAVGLHPRNQGESTQILRIIDSLLNQGADPSHTDTTGKTLVERKLLQKENSRAYREKHPVHPDKVEKVQIQDAHRDVVVEVLQQAMTP